jgi:hypothetical protein
MGTPDPLATADDVLSASAICADALMPAVDRDWSARAGDLEWDCRRTLDHIADTLALYSGYVATRTRSRLPYVRNGDASLTIVDLLATVSSLAAIFAAVLREVPPDTRLFHPAGQADVPGYAALGCEEILMHTDDICRGFGVPFRPPDDLTRRVLRRLFPWAPADGDPWTALRWATGRGALPDRPRLGPDWYWHCAPLDEWDGTIKKRTSPPAWT